MVTLLESLCQTMGAIGQTMQMEWNAKPGAFDNPAKPLIARM